MNELDDALIEDWSEASAPASWVHERTTKWTPEPRSQRAQVYTTHTRGGLVLYVACGTAALMLGLLLSRACLPLLFGSEIVLPKQLFQTGTAEEEAALTAPRTQPAASAAKDSTRARKSSRARQLTAASSSPRGGLQTRLPMQPQAAEELGPPIDPNLPPDLDLMDAPSSAMELRALADSRARMSANSQLLMETQRLHDPMGQLDVLQDPGVELGLLRLNSRPWSQVFIDDKPVGATPLLGVSVKAGQHSVRLVNEAFGMRKTFEVIIRAGESVSQVVSLDN